MPSRGRGGLTWAWRVRPGTQLLLEAVAVEVRSHLVLDDGPMRWVQLRVADDVGGTWRLTVGHDGSSDLVLWEQRETGHPGPALDESGEVSLLDHDGVRWQVHGSRVANYHAEHGTGLEASGRVEQVLYRRAPAAEGPTRHQDDWLLLELFAGHDAASAPLVPSDDCQQCGAAAEDHGALPAARCTVCGTAAAGELGQGRGWELLVGQRLDAEALQRG